MYELSCSSSIIIIPIFDAGANIADLAPIIILALLSFILFHSSYLSPIDNLLCNTAISSLLNLAINLSIIWGVNDISGTSTIAVFPCFNASPINCKYTSVFPEPVTPYNKNCSYWFNSIFSFTFLYAFSCSSVNCKFVVFFISLFISGFLSTFFSIISTYPFFSSVFTIALVPPVNISISGIVAPLLLFRNISIFFCFSDFIFSMSISNCISSVSFFKYTMFTILSCMLFSNFLFFVPGASICLIQSDILQKYLFAIHFASSICFSVRLCFIFLISFTSYSVFSFIPITYPSTRFSDFPNGTSTVLPIIIISSSSFGIL